MLSSFRTKFFKSMTLNKSYDISSEKIYELSYKDREEKSYDFYNNNYGIIINTKGDLDRTKLYSTSEKKKFNFDNKSSKVEDYQGSNRVINQSNEQILRYSVKNAETKEQYVEEQYKILLDYLEDGQFNEGSILLAERCVIDIAETKGFDILGEILQKISIDKYSECPQILSSICQILRRFDLQEVSPWAPIMIGLYLHNKDDEVKSDAISLFDNWNDIESLKLLKGMEFKQGWITEYVKDIIRGIEV